MKYEIEIEGVPAGWNPIAVRVPNDGETILFRRNIEKASADGAIERLIVEKIKQRRIVLEETLEDNIICNINGGYDAQYFVNINLKILGQPKIWREVQENEEQK